MPYGQNTPLQVPRLLKPILDNYNEHVDNFRHFLRTKIHCKLIYEGLRPVKPCTDTCFTIPFRIGLLNISMPPSLENVPWTRYTINR